MKFYHLWGCRWSKREARHIWRRLERDPPPIFFIVLPLDPPNQRPTDTRSHPLDRTHGLSLTLQSMFGGRTMFWIVLQSIHNVSLTVVCFKSLVCLWMFRLSFFAANVWWMNVVLDCFALPWSLQGRGIVCRAWRVPRHLLVGLLCSGQIKMDFFFLLHSRLLWILPRTRIVFFYVCVTRLALQHFIRKQNFHKYNVTLNCKI